MIEGNWNLKDRTNRGIQNKVIRKYGRFFYLNKYDNRKRFK
jgi:hypothetical protein